MLVNSASYSSLASSAATASPYFQIFHDMCVLLVHVLVLSSHILIPEGNYGPYLRIYHPSMFSTMFSLKRMGPSNDDGRKRRVARMGKNKDFITPNHGDTSHMEALSIGRRRSGSILKQRIWGSDEGTSQPSFLSDERDTLVNQIPSTSSRTKMLHSESNTVQSIMDTVYHIVHRSKLLCMTIFYAFGAIICLPLMGVVLYILTRNLIDYHSRIETIMLIPGFNISLGLEAVLLFLSVLSVSLIHEWGHIQCATLFGYRVKQFGWMGFGPLWMGVSDVEWTSREDGSSKKIQKDNWKSKVCILLAGIWHNFCLCGFIYILTSALWINEEGVRIVGSDEAHIIPDSDMRIFKINDGKYLQTTEQYLSSVKNLTSSKHPLVYCLSKQQSTESTVSCCETKSLVGNHFCFESVKKPEKETCLSIKKMTIRSSPTKRNEDCFHLKYPHENWTLISLEVGQKRDRSDSQRVLFYGDVENYLMSLDVTDRHFKWEMDESFLPLITDTIYRFLQISFTLSFGLGMLNLLPIPLFDGSQVVSTLLFEIAKKRASSKVTQRMVHLHLAFVIACGILFFLNVVISLLNHLHLAAFSFFQ